MFRLIKIGLANALIFGALVVAFSPAIASAGIGIASAEIVMMAIGATYGVASVVHKERKQ